MEELTDFVVTVVVVLVMKKTSGACIILLAILFSIKVCPSVEE
jgi:hypothetical protein